MSSPLPGTDEYRINSFKEELQYVRLNLPNENSREKAMVLTKLDEAILWYGALLAAQSKG